MFPVYITYLIKLSLGLGAVYLFYRLVLQNLTFYQCNRWFLLLFTALSFLIPLVNISDWLESDQNTLVVKYIPAVEEIVTGSIPVIPSNMTEPAGFDLWNWLLVILISGSGILLVKSVTQFLSFLHIRGRARLISDKGIKIYQIDGDIIPFSFGRSIFLSASVKQEQDLQEIIRHELVHVQQGHTADILWIELVCILNWFNPFAWLLRHHMRQNLEFIADNNVLQNGTDKKHYQYLLFQIVGEPAFRLAHQFNFSPLKKRIVMMNKIPNTRPHLAKFLFLLPLVAVLLLSFRSIQNSEKLNAQLKSSLINSTSDNDPNNSLNKEPKNLVTWEKLNDNIVEAIFQDGSREKYDLSTEAGKDKMRAAQLFLGDAYKPENTTRNWPKEFSEFLKRNQQVTKIKWRYDIMQLRERVKENDIFCAADRVYLTLKSGIEEIHSIESKADLAKFENKFGKLPMLPPPVPTLVPAK